MKLTKKIPAFTINELLIVLVITSIVISMSFLILSMVQKQVSVIKNNLENKQEILSLERILINDFNNFTVNCNNLTDELVFYNAIDTVTYSFKDSFIIRNNDTIPIKVSNKEVFLNGKTTNNGIVDAIRLNFSNTSFLNNKLFIHKTKDASFYINN